MKWVTRYDTDDSLEKRYFAISSKNKTDYIFSLLIKNNIHIEIISNAITTLNNKFYKKKEKKINNNIKLISLGTFNMNNRFIFNLSKIYSVISLFFYLLKSTKKNETIIVGHSLINALPVYFAKKIKKFKIILDLGEEFNKVKKGNFIYQWIEPKIIENSSKFIFGNDLMAGIYNISKENYVVIYGEYQNNYNENIKKLREIDKKIHLVYAGIISRDEGSALRAIKLAEHLPNNYVIHILGEVENEYKKDFFSFLDKANLIVEKKVIYEGKKTGKDYIKTMLQYDIGLNLRLANEEYIDFAFPSKILSYLNLGLHVVSSKINCVYNSKIGDLLDYFDVNDSKIIADVIIKVNLSEKYNPLKRLEMMNEILVDKIKKLLIEEKNVHKN